MNNLRAMFSRVSANIPKGAPGGAPGGGVPAGAGAGITGLLLLGLGGYTAYYSLVTVQPGHKGVVYNRIGGLDDTKTLKEGLNIVIPWFQRPVVYDIRTRPQQIETNSGSKGMLFTFIDFLLLC